MEQTGDKNTKTVVQIGHENFFKYSFSQNTRRVRFHGKRTEKEMVYFKIKDLIDEGITSTGDLALRLGKSTRQTRRYLKRMARLRMIKLDSRLGNVNNSLPKSEFLSIENLTTLGKHFLTLQPELPTDAGEYLDNWGGIVYFYHNN